MTDNQQMDPVSDDEFEAMVANAPARKAALDFATAHWVERDMRATWRLTHPTLRRCWTQAWLMPNLDTARGEEYDPDEIVEAFAEDEVDHPLWEPFARAAERRATLPASQATWGVNANPVVVAPDVLLVRYLPVPDSGVIQPGELYASVPLVVQYEEGAGWRLLNFVSEQIPEPGWPPRLGGEG
jgi:hypothetical protein